MANIFDETINELIKFLKKSGFLSTKELVDKYYSVQELYEHRLVLFKIICHTYPHLAWKAKRHFDGSMFNDSFLSGIVTPLGNASYHFKLDRFDEFKVTEIESAPKYDGYTSDEALDRINSLPLLGNDYIDTGNNLLGTYRDWQRSNIKIPEEKSQQLVNIINGLIGLLKEMDVIKTTDISDGNHTFRQLYKQKRELFKLICHNYVDLAWKSKYDAGGNIISEDTFIAGLNTPLGPVGYVLNDERFEQFNIESLSKAPINKKEIYYNVTKKLSSLNIRILRR